MTCPRECDCVKLRWSVVVEQVAQTLTVHLWLEVENTMDRALPVAQLKVLVAPSGLRHIPAADLEVAQTGWQSWSYATPPVPLADWRAGEPAPVFSPLGFSPDEARLLVPWVTVVQAQGAGTLLAGFTTARDLTGMLAIEPAPHGHQCVAFNDGEGVLLAPGATLHSVIECRYPASLTGSVALCGGDTPAKRFVMQLEEPKGWRLALGREPPVTGSRRTQVG